MELQLRLFFLLLFKSSDAIHANDLDTLLPAWLITRLKGKQLVYDTHEYFTGVPELISRPAVRKVWRSIESFIFPRLKKVITVNQSIAGLYQNDFGVTPIVIRNLPSGNTSLIHGSREELNLPLNRFILIIQGNGINIDRGSEEAVEMMKYLEEALLLIIGSGDVIPKLEERIRSNQLEDKVWLRPRMPYSELMKHTSVCDLGLSLDKNSNINYRFSLPNKLFDYIRAGIPVMVSDLPEVRKIVEEAGCGIISDSHDPQILARKVNELRAHPEILHKLKSGANKASNLYRWENDVEQIKSWYA